MSTQLNTVFRNKHPALPQYRSHKIVEALKLREVSVIYVTGKPVVAMMPEGSIYPPFRVSAEYYDKHKPIAGGYWLRYDNGYESWSPAKEFEEGYNRIRPTSPVHLERLRTTVGKDFLSEQEVDVIQQAVYAELHQENQGVIGGPDVVQMLFPGRFAEAIIEAVVNKVQLAA